MQLLEGRPGAGPVEILEHPWRRAYVADERGNVGEPQRRVILANFFDHPACGLELGKGDIGSPDALVDRQAKEPANRGALVATDLFSEEFPRGLTIRRTSTGSKPHAY